MSVNEEQILTGERVRNTMKACLFNDDELKSGLDGSSVFPRSPIRVDGVIGQYGFDPEHIAEQKENIRTLLNELHSDFHFGAGGGQSFLNACVDKHGNHWAEHSTIEELMCLGMAAGFVRYTMPCEMWAVLPGGMPYICVDTRVDLTER